MRMTKKETIDYWIKNHSAAVEQINQLQTDLTSAKKEIERYRIALECIANDGFAEVNSRAITEQALKEKSDG